MDDDVPALFRVFNEIGIVNQLATAILQSKLPKDVLPAHFTVLNHLVRVQDGATPLALASAFQVPKTTMTHTLSGLEKHGWIAMRRNPDDARSKQVWLTPAGRAFRDGTIAALGPEIARIDRDLPEVGAALLPGLTALRQYLDRTRD